MQPARPRASNLEGLLAAPAAQSSASSSSHRRWTAGHHAAPDPRAAPAAQGDEERVVSSRRKRPARSTRREDDPYAALDALDGQASVIGKKGVLSEDGDEFAPPRRAASEGDAGPAARPQEAPDAPDGQTDARVDEADHARPARPSIIWSQRPSILSSQPAASGAGMHADGPGGGSPRGAASSGDVGEQPRAAATTRVDAEAPPPQAMRYFESMEAMMHLDSRPQGWEPVPHRRARGDGDEFAPPRRTASEGDAGPAACPQEAPDAPDGQTDARVDEADHARFAGAIASLPWRPRSRRRRAWTTATSPEEFTGMEAMRYLESMEDWEPVPHRRARGGGARGDARVSAGLGRSGALSTVAEDVGSPAGSGGDLPHSPHLPHPPHSPHSPHAPRAPFPHPPPFPPPRRPLSALAEFEAEMDDLLARQHELRRRFGAFVAMAAVPQAPEDDSLRTARDLDAAAAPDELQRRGAKAAVDHGARGLQGAGPPGGRASSASSQDDEADSTSSDNLGFDDSMHRGRFHSMSFHASMHLAQKARRDNDWRAKLLRATSTSHYEMANSFVIFVNVMFIAWETHHSAKQAPAKGGAFHFDVFMFVFCALFAADVAARVLAQGLRFFYSVDWKWNWFDVIVVTGSLMEVIAYCLESHSSVLSTSSLLRVLRLVKVMRIVRALRSIVYFRVLRISVSMLCEAVIPLMMFVLINAMVFLVFGIFFTEGATEYVVAHGAADYGGGGLSQHYGDLFVTMLTLFKSITGGIYWEMASEPLERLPGVYSVVFYAYVVWSVFAMMNVVSAIFIDSTIQRSKHDREFVVQGEIQEKREFMATMDKLFVELDPDSSGTIRLEELQSRIRAPRVSAYFRSIDLNPVKVKMLFQLMDSNGSGDIDRAEFKKGCDRLRGDANQLDLAIVQLEVKQMNRTTAKIMGELARISEQLESRMPSSRPVMDA